MLIRVRVAIYHDLGRQRSRSGFSRDAANLSTELRAGGCFCERLKDGRSVQHLQVVYAAPRKSPPQ
jgi:hypothetical protein